LNEEKQSEILHEDEDVCVFKLSQHLSSTPGNISQVFLHIDTHPAENIVLSHVYSRYGETEAFAMSFADADAFCRAWMDYSVKCIAKHMAEEKRLEEVHNEAMKLAQEYPSIVIHSVDDENPSWRVTEQQTKFDNYDVWREDDNSYRAARTADELLSDVTYAIERLESHYRNLADGIVASCPEIEIQRFEDEQGGWYVSCPEVGMYSLARAKTGKELLELVQTAQEELQARQHRAPDPRDEQREY
jgi:predicted RNase H-like HicB family nuclease